MSKSLVIVESPSKAKIINRFLGDQYIVTASVGHIRDLPAGGSKTGRAKAGTNKKVSAQSRLFTRMGIDPEHNWQAHYEIMPGKEEVVARLKKLAGQADTVYLATDLDREGEAIAWHLREVLGGKDKRFLRVKYPEITKRAISKAFENPSDIDMDLVNAQQTRRFLDRVVGFMVSPLLWVKIARGLSAGRVQSVAAELIVNREREIKAFVPVEYWTIAALTQSARGEDLLLQLISKSGSKLELKNQEEAEAAAAELKQQIFRVNKVESRKGSVKAPPPFTTSTLQQSANQKLGFSVRRTMVTAQRLYEAGFITYMRTDSVNLSQEAIAAARELIAGRYGAEYLPEKPNFFKSKDNAQEAHEAIRPSHPEENGATLPADLGRDEQRLYQLIYQRYLACQMAPMQYESVSVQVQAGSYGLKASGRTVLFKGFTAAWPSASRDESILPRVCEGEGLDLIKLDRKQHFTQPPARYSEAALVKELEKDGIGRPSTYASIITTIQDRGYVRVERGRFFAEKLGEIVTDRLRYSFADLMNTSFTASMEEQLDEIARGRRNWIESLDNFYADLKRNLDKAALPFSEGGMPENKSVVIKEIICPHCGKYPMALHEGKTGAFLSCQGYFDKSVPAKERCRQTMNLKPAICQHDEDDASYSLRHSRRCPKCGTAMDAFIIDEHRKLYICGNAPQCDGYLYEEGDFSDEVEHGPEIVCDKCGAPMILKEGRFGKYMACTNADCGNTRKILKNGEVAPPKEPAVDLPELSCKTAGSHYVLRDGAAGLFLAAHNFPKVRETRAPLVSELKCFRDRISPKFYYLADGPEFDPEGNPAQVRFSRKFKQQYLTSFTADGKPTGWTALYDAAHDVWIEHQSEKKGGSKRTARTRSKA